MGKVREMLQETHDVRMGRQSLFELVAYQLPAGIHDKVRVVLERDAHDLTVKAKFWTAGDTAPRLVAECCLESLDFDGFSRMARIPDLTLTHLCAVV